jgi:hypothetical protein
MTTIDGLPACSCLAAWIPAFEKKIGHGIAWVQMIGNAPQSEGFHAGGGAADCAPLSTSDLRTARNMGSAAWNRSTAQGFSSNHCHIRLNGCPHNSVAQPQVADLNAGRDGTGPLWDTAGAKDNGPRDGVAWPLRTWQQGIDWAQGDDLAGLTPEEHQWLHDAAQKVARIEDELGVTTGEQGRVTGVRLHEDVERIVTRLGGSTKDGSVTLTEQVRALAAKVDAISVGGIDADALAAKVADLLADRLKA